MTFIIADRVKESTSSTGTGTLALAGASTGFRAFSVVCANNDTVAYAISSSGGSEWETGLGTWTTGNNLARTTVIASSNANAAVSFSAGTKDVYLSVIAAQLSTQSHVCGGRLTLTSGVPVTTGDVTGATTIYLAPYSGNEAALYTGGMWRTYRSGELSVALGTLVNATNYDVLRYDNAGTDTLIIGPAWTSDAARGTGAGTTELELFEGVYVNKVAISGGPAARAGRYLGTFRTTSTTTTEDSVLNRFVANFYNPVLRIASQTDTTSHTINNVNRIWRAGTQTRSSWVQPFASFVKLATRFRLTPLVTSNINNVYVTAYLNGVQSDGFTNTSYGGQSTMWNGSFGAASAGYNYADAGEAEFSSLNVDLDYGETVVELWQ